MNTRRLIATLYALLLAGLATGAGVLFYAAHEEYNQLKQAEAVSRRHLAEAEARLAAQEKILQRLQTDPAYVEKVLRRNGYAKPGEFIFRYDD